MTLFGLEKKLDILRDQRYSTKKMLLDVIYSIISDVYYYLDLNPKV